jgi:hypothetical protein
MTHSEPIRALVWWSEAKGKGGGYALVLAATGNLPIEIMDGLADHLSWVGAQARADGIWIWEGRGLLTGTPHSRCDSLVLIGEYRRLGEVEALALARGVPFDELAGIQQTWLRGLW